MTHTRKKVALRWTIILTVLLAVFAFLMFPDLSGSRHSTRSRESRALSEMRSLAVAIETYHLDNDCYPAMTALSEWVPAPKLEKLRETGGIELTTVAWGRPSGTGLHGLTTPIAYVGTVFGDPFHPVPDVHLPFAYAAIEKRWILFSPGRDKKYNIVAPLQMLDGTDEEVRNRLSPFTYDPTNGTVSDGDLWRLKQ